MYVRIYIYTYIHIYIYIYIYVDLSLSEPKTLNPMPYAPMEYRCMHICMYMYICIYVYMYICVYVYMCVCIYIYDPGSRFADPPPNGIPPPVCEQNRVYLEAAYMSLIGGIHT